MKEPRIWTRESDARLAEFIEALAAPDFVPATWPAKAELTREDGVMQMPYPTYVPLVDQLWKFLFAYGFHRHPYELLPEDPPDAKAGMETHFIVRSIEEFERASVDQISRYFALCHRAERFADGHIDQEFSSGRMLAALIRLRTLMALEMQ